MQANISRLDYTIRKCINELWDIFKDCDDKFIQIFKHLGREVLPSDESYNTFVTYMTNLSEKARAINNNLIRNYSSDTNFDSFDASSVPKRLYPSSRSRHPDESPFPHELYSFSQDTTGGKGGKSKKSRRKSKKSKKSKKRRSRNSF